MQRINPLGKSQGAGTLMRSGRNLSNSLFRLVVRPSAFPDARFVFVAGRAVDKRAVVRNRLRRRAAEYIRTHLTEAPAHRDIAVIIKKEAATATRNVFYDALKQILARVR